METKDETKQHVEVKSSRPNQPVASFLQEAENLYAWCIDDIQELMKAGIDEALVNELPGTIKACREAQTQLKKKLKTPGDAQVQWKLQLLEARSLRKELIHSMRFAFKEEADLLNSVKAISKRRGYASIIQGLYDLSVLGHANTQLLTAIGLDLGLLETAAVTSTQLATLWAQSKNEKAHLIETTVLRNKAFWYLHQQVTEIRRAGQYIFRHRKDHLVGYISQYWKQKNERKNTPGK